MRRRVLVLGGGPAALAAAFELSDPAHPDGPFDVTVLTRGWRLGGKGASGRNREEHDRIEEHGLHLWFGFYREAFALLEEVYAAAGELAPGPVHEAFSPVEHLAFWHRPEADGPWSRWVVPLPAASFPDRLREAPGPYGQMRALLQSLRALFRTGRGINGMTLGATLDDEPLEGPVPEALEDDRQQRDLLARPAYAGAARALRAAAVELEQRAAGKATGAAEGGRLMARLCDLCGTILWRLLEEGCIKENGGIEPEALRALDDVDFCQWLRPHCVVAGTVDAPFVRALYDLVFGYENGERSAPSVAASVLLRGFLRITFEHQRSLMMRMEGGMGDVVFAPLHHALQSRGVKIEYFRSVTALRQAGGRVTEVDVVHQAQLVGDTYEPLIADHTGVLRLWPNAPLWDQLVDGDRLAAEGVDFERQPDVLAAPTRTLRDGDDFDAVVLGIPVGALKHLGGDLSSDPCSRWSRMLANASTVATQSGQLWIAGGPPEPGVFPVGGAVTGGSAGAFDTAADFGHLVAREGWPDDTPVGQLAYLCGVLAQGSAGGTQAEADAAVAESLRTYVDDPRHPDLAERVEDRFVRANVSGSDRYVLSLPGSLRHRLDPGGSGWANLALAGDWTRTELPAGCVEAAVSSGRAAARAVAAMGRSRVTGPIPAASWWSASSTPFAPPDVLFDFPGLKPGDHFTPRCCAAYIALRGVPFTAPWMATAVVETVDDQRLTWREENELGPVRFAAEVEFRRTSDYGARLRIAPRLNGRRVPTLNTDYAVIVAEANLLVVRRADAPADMLGVMRQEGDVLQFHLRMPFGFAIHKTGDLDRVRSLRR